MKRDYIIFFFVFFLQHKYTYSQDVNLNVDKTNFFEIYYSPFQTRIGGLEYNISKVNHEGALDTRTRINSYQINNFEIGLNYLFKIKQADLSVGLSYFTDSYKYSVFTAVIDRLYKVNISGLSLNLFYRKQIFEKTFVDLGFNNRITINYYSNRNDYSNNEIFTPVDVVVSENWNNEIPLQITPSIQFNTKIHKGFFIRYGFLAKFWGKDFYSITANKKSDNQEIFLDFSANSSVLKGTISIGYKFHK